MADKGGGRPKGLPKTGGRAKGTPNKETKALREMILQALDDQPGGGVEYLKMQAQENPGAFMTLLGKVLPSQTQLSGPNGGPIPVSSLDPKELTDDQLAAIAASRSGGTAPKA